MQDVALWKGTWGEMRNTALRLPRPALQTASSLQLGTGADPCPVVQPPLGSADFILTTTTVTTLGMVR